MLRLLITIAVLVAAPLFATSKSTPDHAATLKDIKQTFGFVPKFLNGFPAEGLSGAWAALKNLGMSNTAIPGKYKSLISMSVAAQIPCTYCLEFDSQAAKLDGATKEELAEAVNMSAIVRHWSTVLNGMQIDEDTFRMEVTRIMEHAKTAKPAEPTPGLAAKEAAIVYQDIEKTLGMVPTFLKAYPPEAIGGAWAEMKEVQLSPNTALPPKYKELIALAVAAQIPCRYCTVFHTEALRAHGASDREIAEAVAIAASARHWSTWFNGMQVDQATFKKEVAQIMQHLKKQQTLN